MEEESVEGTCAIQMRESDPEIGSTGIVSRVKKAVGQSKETGFIQVILEIAKGMEKGHIPNAKFIWDFLKRLEAEEDVPQDEYESFAAVLWKEYQRLEEEQGNEE